jgi:hypothetical protein
MLPSFVLGNEPDITTADAEDSCNIGFSFSRNYHSKNLLHVIFCQFGAALPFAFSHSPFLMSVAHIVGVGAKKEMVRADTLGNVATMANLYSFGNNTMVNFPTEAMRKLSSFISAYLSMTKRHGAASPKPASSSFVNLAPKALLRGKRSVRTVTCLGTKQAATTVEVAYAYAKFFLAIITTAQDTWDSAIGAARGSMDNARIANDDSGNIKFWESHMSSPNKKPFAGHPGACVEQALVSSKGQSIAYSDMPGLTNMCLLDRCNCSTGGSKCPI